MATVNFSVPDDVKEAFDRTFGDGNKSAVIAELMRKAVAEVELRQRRAKLFQRLTAGRPHRPAASDRETRQARTAGRG